MAAIILAALSGVLMAQRAIPVPGDARVGEQIVRTQQCLACHNIRGDGGNIAPDFARRTAAAYSPSLMAALMWNHAPTMWATMDRKGIARPTFTEEQAAHLFAFFYSLRYFEQPGDAARGRRIFVDRKCAGCHDGATAPSVSNWTAWTDPIELASAMWNHAPRMRKAVDTAKLPWPLLTSQEMTDILVYAQSQPKSRGATRMFSVGSAESGAALFRSKDCATCHSGSLSLEGRVRSHSMTDFAASMWSHAPRMIQFPPDITPLEMRRLVGYLWSIQHFENPGDARRGEKVWTRKRCGTCHDSGSPSPAPSLAGRRINSIAVVAALWKHGPAMLEELNRRNIPWPRFRNDELVDLLEFVAHAKKP